MWKILIRPAMIVVPLAVGFFFPQAGILAKSPDNVVRISLFFMIFMASLGIEFRDLQPVRDHWKLLIANVLMGLIPYWLCKWFLPDHPELALIVFFIGITPTAAASSVIISLLNGKVGFGLTGFPLPISVFLWHCWDCCRIRPENLRRISVWMWHIRSR